MAMGDFLSSASVQKMPSAMLVNSTTAIAVFFHQTMRNAPTSVQRRQREKLRGLVKPSPVGLAMVNEV